MHDRDFRAELGDDLSGAMPALFRAAEGPPANGLCMLTDEPSRMAKRKQDRADRHSQLFVNC